MPYTSTPLSNGAVMDWADIKTNLDDIRSWINSVPSSDMVDGSVQTEHLVRPVVEGFPKQSLEGSFQQGHWSNFGLEEPTAVKPDEWGGRVRRFTFIPTIHDGVTNIWWLPVGRSFYLPAASSVEAHVTMEWQVRGTANSPFYPLGAGAGDRLGFFVFHIRDRATGTTSPYNPGLRHVYPIENAAGAALPIHTDGGHVSYVAENQLPSGYYDLVLAYHRGGTPDDPDLQIDVSRIQFHLEVL